MVVVIYKTVDKTHGLTHHGIKGQRWGVRNGPPYPLDYQDHSSAALQHYGIKGMHWGIRRYQNEDGTLTEAGKRHYQKKDDRWVKRKADSIEEKAYKQSQREMKKVAKQLDRKYGIKNAYERQGRTYMNEYNQNLARIMNTKVSNLKAPSGRLVKFVAKRGEYGVHMALADPGYDMDQVKNGIWDSGRVAYRKHTIEKR